MSDRDPIDLEAEKLHLIRIASAPDAWRSRATAAGGLLATAAAAALLSLLSGGLADLEDAARASASVTGVTYVLAVALFLTAAVLPPPDVDQAETTDFPAALAAYAAREARPIKVLAVLGTILGVLAVAGTATTAILAATESNQRWVWVHVKDGAALDGVLEACSGLKNPFEGKAQRGDLVLPIVPIEVTCPSGTATIYLQSDQIVVVDD